MSPAGISSGADRDVLAGLEAASFSALNQIVEPAVRFGLGSPGIFTVGLIVLETNGWRTGRRHRTPVLASVIGRHLLVSTVRGNRSHWMKNLSRHPEIQYWSWGRQRTARAVVFASDEASPRLDELPLLLAPLGAHLNCLARTLGWAFALLTPRDGETRRQTGS